MPCKATTAAPIWRACGSPWPRTTTNPEPAMQHWKIKLSLFLNYFVFAILLNSVGTVILQVQRNYGVTQSAASVLEAFKDLSIAAVSFVVASYITRIGYKNAML